MRDENPVAIRRAKILDEYLPLESAGNARYVAFVASRVILRTGENPIPMNMRALAEEERLRWGDDNDRDWHFLSGSVVLDERLMVLASHAAEAVADFERGTDE